MGHTKTTHGFTLIEMIVSLAIFSIVATVAIGALLMLVGTNERLQGEQAITSNISFALDSMVREMRTGGKYYCHTSNNNSSGIDRIFNPADIAAHNIDTRIPVTTTNSCPRGRNGSLRYHGLAFIEGGDSISGAGRRILYYFDYDEKVLYRRVGSSVPQPVLSENVSIDDFDMYVSSTLDSDARQPSITIYLKATENGLGTDKPFYFQTTVTPRTLGI